MGFPVDLFIRKDLEEDFICTICQDVLQEARVVLPCEHTFCQHCIATWMTHSNTCPNDRETILRSVAPHRGFLNLLNALQLECVFSGCQTIIRLGDLREHEGRCPANPENIRAAEEAAAAALVAAAAAQAALAAEAAAVALAAEAADMAVAAEEAAAVVAAVAGAAGEDPVPGPSSQVVVGEPKRARVEGMEEAPPPPPFPPPSDSERQLFLTTMARLREEQRLDNIRAANANPPPPYHVPNILSRVAAGRRRTLRLRRAAAASSSQVVPSSPPPTARRQIATGTEGGGGGVGNHSGGFQFNERSLNRYDSDEEEERLDYTNFQPARGVPVPVVTSTSSTSSSSSSSGPSTSTSALVSITITAPTIMSTSARISRATQMPDSSQSDRAARFQLRLYRPQMIRALQRQQRRLAADIGEPATTITIGSPNSSSDSSDEDGPNGGVRVARGGGSAVGGSGGGASSVRGAGGGGGFEGVRAGAALAPPAGCGPADSSTDSSSDSVIFEGEFPGGAGAVNSFAGVVGPVVVSPGGGGGGGSGAEPAVKSEESDEDEDSAASSLPPSPSASSSTSDPYELEGEEEEDEEEEAESAPPPDDPERQPADEPLSGELAQVPNLDWARTSPHRFAASVLPLSCSEEIKSDSD